MARPFQFSLKTIFVLVLVAAAFFGGMAVQRRETNRALQLAEQERERAEASERQAMDAMMAERAARAEAEAALARTESDDSQQSADARENR